jgi:hypothetical protein
MARDIITGNWTGPKNLPYAKWTTNGSSAQGFGVVNQSTNSGRLYIDSNKNGARDRGDKVIANLTKTKEEVTPYDAKGGTWSLDLNTKEGIFYNRDGVELIAAQYTNTSYF